MNCISALVSTFSSIEWAAWVVRNTVCDMRTHINCALCIIHWLIRSLTYCHTSENNSKISWHKIVPLVPELSHVRNVLRNSENLLLAPIVIFFKLSGVFDEKQLCYFLLCNHFLLNYFPQNRPQKSEHTDSGDSTDSTDSSDSIVSIASNCSIVYSFFSFNLFI